MATDSTARRTKRRKAANPRRTFSVREQLVSKHGVDWLRSLARAVKHEKG